MKIIEPSEILTGEERRLPSIANPWIRFLARFFDYGWFFMAILGLASLFPPLQFLLTPSWIPYEFVVWIPVEACFLAFLGTTPGKWLTGTQIKGVHGKVHYKRALMRSFLAWFRGMGMGIFGLNFFTLLWSYHRLKALKSTSWDLELGIDVREKAVGSWRLVLAVLVLFTSTIFYYQEKYQHARPPTRPVSSVSLPI